ncbi:MAG: hypothetical protein ACOY32_03175 [Thermodesulfobacteriota bacterium]
MDWLTFVSEIVKTTTWPFAFLVAIIVFKDEISELLVSLASRSMRARWGDKQLDIDALDIREKTLDARKKAQGLPVPDTDEVVKRYYRQARTKPRTALLDSWKNLTTSASQAIGSKGTDQDIGITLKEAGIINDEQFRLFTGLKEVRDKARFIPEYAVDPETATNYAEASSKLEKYIKQRMTTPGK